MGGDGGSGRGRKRSKSVYITEICGCLEIANRAGVDTDYRRFHCTIFKIASVAMRALDMQNIPTEYTWSRHLSTEPSFHPDRMCNHRPIHAC